LLDFSVEGFRCFRERADFCEPGHVNVIAGPNNSGKSSLLSVLRRLTTTHFQPVQKYRGVTFLSGDQIQMLRFPPSDVTTGSEKFTITFRQALPGGAVLQGTLAKRIAVRGGVIRILFAPDGQEPADDPPAHRSEPRRRMNEVLNTAARQIVYVPAQRRVEPILHESELQDPEESAFNGSSILPNLLGYANPSREFDPTGMAGRKLTAIEATMASLLGEDVHVIPLPAEREVEITIGGRTVGLRRLGAGLEQLLVLAAAFVEHPDGLLLIEEPENFLHPTLQRRVLEHLLLRTGDSVVTTHSNHLLDVRDARLAYYRTFHKAAGCGVERVSGYRKYEFLWDLGVRPSSLFESNAVLWVEGPSDAILLRAWLAFLPEAESLIEGIHYTFGFHAGSLLDKFFIDWKDAGATDEQHIVNFCALHPNFFIVADSDGDGTNDFGHDYLRRIAPQAVERGLLWATYGKEIENYLPQAIFRKYLTSRATPRRTADGTPSVDDLRWSPVWRIFNTLCGETAYSSYPNKVTFAEWSACELKALPPTEVLGVFDLATRLKQVVAFIRRASGARADEPSHPEQNGENAGVPP
jgi:predicted ATPase